MSYCCLLRPCKHPQSVEESRYWGEAVYIEEHHSISPHFISSVGVMDGYFAEAAAEVFSIHAFNEYHPDFIPGFFFYIQIMLIMFFIESMNVVPRVSM